MKQRASLVEFASHPPAEFKERRFPLARRPLAKAFGVALCEGWQVPANKAAMWTSPLLVVLYESPVDYRQHMKNFWLVKQEPSSYSWSDFTRDGGTSWTGVRNYTARNNLREMGKGDEVLFYHTGEEKAVVGIAKVTRTAYPDRTATEGDWSAVDLVPVKPLPRPVTLAQIKQTPRLNKMKLVRQSRLSVMPVTSAEFDAILKMGK